MFNSCAKRKKTGQESGSGDDGNTNNPPTATLQKLPSIFVKIPLEINQQYQNRRTNLIKSEVKFENHDPKTPTPPASTPTPPASSMTPERPLSLPSINTIHGTSNLFVVTGSDNSRGSNSSAAEEKQQPPAIYRCELCPFISIYEDNLYSHIDEHTQRKFLRKKYFCPGCDNVHYEKAALESHFAQDHAMTVEETSVLVDYVLKYNSFGPSRKGRGKGRITIKNATQLKKPDLLLENGQESSNVPTPPKPKIFVKSVQYLKGPEFCFDTAPVPVLDTTNAFPPQSSLDPFQFHASEPTAPSFASIFNTIPLQNDVTSSYFDSNLDDPVMNCLVSDPNMGDFDPIVLERPAMSTSEPIMTTSTQDTLSSVNKGSNSGKIYLKDISVLQDPRPIVSEEPLQQPTIHLKTVDELNAMAFNPNLNMSSAYSNFSMDLGLQDCFGTVNNDIINLDESEISDLIELNNDDNYSQNSFTALLNHDFDSVSMDDESKKVEVVPSSSHETDKDVLVSGFEQTVRHLEENDEDILFVCAQELIDSNLADTKEQKRDLEESVQPLMPIDTKPRIYLATNLTNDLVPPPTPIQIETPPSTFATPKSKIGRPKGARKSGVSTWRKTLPENITEDDVLGPKCQIDRCALRFKCPKNMDYHRQCHTLMQNGDTVCPECRSAEFKNWNTLHTHLWRTHNIDMELYACNQCSFKTPILARLKSEHMKIHSNVHEYKCGLCGRGFKNSKQRKHHVRMHRLRMSPVVKASATSSKKPKARQCNQCPMTFVNTVALESHIIDFHTLVPEKKDILSKLPDTILQGGNQDIKKYRCSECNYESNDHNAFRRHKFQHSKGSLYKCPFCAYSSIQSTTYRKHLEKQHPDKAANFVFKCHYMECKFTTISKQKFECHVIRHKANGDHLSEADSRPLTTQMVSNKAKIKVRQILRLTDPINVSGTNFIRPASFATIESEPRTSEEQDVEVIEYIATVNDSDSL